eukprot:3419936-Prymnesium_polylepis.1
MAAVTMPRETWPRGLYETRWLRASGTSMHFAPRSARVATFSFELLIMHIAPTQSCTATCGV